jgi:hypothetical protein
MHVTIKCITCIGFGLLTGCGSMTTNYPELTVHTDNLYTTVAFLSQIEPARNYVNTQSLNRVADYIAAAFESYGLDVSRQRFHAANNEYQNIIAGLGPEDASRIVVGAHYDVCGDQPGADDNASGIAGVLEAARVLSQYATQLTHRIEFVAYALEEPPFYRTRLMGSYIHARSLHTNEVPVTGMICLEMIGYYSSVKGSQQVPFAPLKLMYPSRGDFIGVVGNFGSGNFVKSVQKHMQHADIGVHRLIGPSIIPGVDFSDHLNYWKFGYKAAMITDTAFYRNPHYHASTDTIDTLDFEKMKEVVKGICWAIMYLE